MSGPCTYDNMVKLFQDKMAGGKVIFYSASGAPHKPRSLFVEMIDLKPFSFLPLAFFKVQRGAPRVSSSGNRQLDKNQPAANFDAG